MGAGEVCWMGFWVAGFVDRVGAVGFVCLGYSDYLSEGDGSG